MKAVWGKAPFQFQVRNIPQPNPSPVEVLIKIEACGVCGTDVGLAKNGATGWMPLGHEAVGVVEDIGSQVNNVKVGDKVVVENHTACGGCESCKNGDYVYCQDLRQFQYPSPNAQAAFAEYICLHQSMVDVYDKLTPLQATLAEPLTVAMDLTLRVDIPLNGEVVVFGPGPIGLMTVKIVKLQGARRVFLCGLSHTEPRESYRLMVGKKLGADITIGVKEVDVVDTIKKYVARGVDRVLVTAPPQVIPQTIRITKFGGIIGYIGINWSKTGGLVNLDLNELHFRKLQLRSSHAIPNSRFPIALDLLQRKVIDPDKLITHTFKLEETEKAIKTAASPMEKAIKVVIVP